MHGDDVHTSLSDKKYPVAALGHAVVVVVLVVVVVVVVVVPTGKYVFGGYWQEREFVCMCACVIQPAVCLWSRECIMTDLLATVSQRVGVENEARDDLVNAGGNADVTALKGAKEVTTAGEIYAC